MEFYKPVFIVFPWINIGQARPALHMFLLISYWLFPNKPAPSPAFPPDSCLVIIPFSAALFTALSAQHFRSPTNMTLTNTQIFFSNVFSSSDFGDFWLYFKGYLLSDVSWLVVVVEALVARCFSWNILRAVRLHPQSWAGAVTRCDRCYRLQWGIFRGNSCSACNVRSSYWRQENRWVVA